jgi:caffeoyl-CoA O-methyltransferase
MDQALFTAVDRYIADLLIPPDEALAATERSLRDAGMPEISVSPVQGQFLHLLALLCQAKNILEIGTLAGYSAIWLARALPADGRLVTLEYEPAYAAVARKNFERAGLSDKVDLRVGKALDLLPALEGPFDMIFIDADKPPYAEYFQWALRLSRPGTLIVADNVIREGQVLDAANTDEKVIGVRRFNQVLADTPAVSAGILPMVGLKEFDGMALAVVKRR